MSWFVSLRSEASDRGDRLCGSVDEDKYFLLVVMMELRVSSWTTFFATKLRVDHMCLGGNNNFWGESHS